MKLSEDEYIRARKQVEDKFLQYEKACKILDLKDDLNKFYDMLNKLAEEGWDGIILDSLGVNTAKELSNTVKII